jgi:hypothetical protein
VIKINATGQEYCLPCADDIEGVIVERGGVCVICEAERESEQTLCGDCLRPDCYHLEQVRGRV